MDDSIGFEKILPLVRRTLRLSPCANLVQYAHLVRLLEKTLEGIEGIVHEARERILIKMIQDKIETLVVSDGQFVVVAPHVRTRVDLTSVGAPEPKLDFKSLGAILRFYPSKEIKVQKQIEKEQRQLDQLW